MGKPRGTSVDRSIPYAQRMMMQKAQTWHDEREDAVKVAMYHASDKPDVERKNLCDAMVQLGFFRTSTGQVMAWIDENGNPVRVKGGKDGLIRATG